MCRFAENRRKKNRGCYHVHKQNPYNTYIIIIWVYEIGCENERKSNKELYRDK